MRTDPPVSNDELQLEFSPIQSSFWTGEGRLMESPEVRWTT